jgi:hypothetical protein
MYVGDGLVKLWDPRDGSYVKRLQGHTSEGDKNIHTYFHTYIHSYFTCRSIKIILKFVSVRQYFRFGIPTRCTRSSFWSPQRLIARY